MRFLSDHPGELAALAAAMCWVITATAFAAAGRRIGSTAVNIARLFIAIAVLGLICRVLLGSWIPPVTTESLWLLGLSGLVGLAIGDQFLFTAFVDVGPRISLLVMTVVPPTVAVMAWPVLDEPLGWIQIAGILVTMGGIAWVIAEQPAPAATESGAPIGAHRSRGVIYAAIGGFCQAIGVILSKLGMGHVPGAEMPPVDPVAATLYRMLFAAGGMMLFITARRIWRAPTAHLVRRTRPDRRAVVAASGFVLLGAVFGPVLGVWCMMIAVDRALAGVATTLMAMTPVFVLPLSRWIEKEHISRRAVLGAIIAVAGVAILTLFGNGGGS